MKEPAVEHEVKNYLLDKFPQFSVFPQCNIHFGTKSGIADLVLHQPTKSGMGRFVAIAEVKRRPLPILRKQARAQLKSYLSATSTKYGVLAIGVDPNNWEFCENKFDNLFSTIDRNTFEKGVENWTPSSEKTLELNLKSERKALRWWKRITLALAFALVVSVGVNFIPQDDLSIVYTTRTGKKYHTFDCMFLKEHNITEKFAILLRLAKHDYEPCGICNPDGEALNE